MHISSAQFIQSNSDVKKCPSPDRHEYAFIGRSNVGKSSLINMLTARKSLAKTAAKPGKTQLINHFVINDEWYMVDLPGYGYAQASKNAREMLTKIIQDYILERSNLICLFVLIDSRHIPQKIDLEFMEWLGECGIPFVIVFTKTDKLSTKQCGENIEFYKSALLERWESLPKMFLTSSEKNIGRDELLDYIDELNRTVTL